jgi:hypothetical protein
VAVATCSALFITPSEAFFHVSSPTSRQPAHLSTTQICSSTEATTTSATTTTRTATTTAAATVPKKGIENLTIDIVAKLRFREVQRELEARQLDTSGTFTDMRQRLRHVAAVEVGEEPIASPKYTESGNIRLIDEESLNNVSFAYWTKKELCGLFSFLEKLMTASFSFFTGFSGHRN